MQQALTDKVKLIVTDSRLAFMQGKYEESLRLAKQALVTKIDLGSYINENEKQQYHQLALK